jgi:predicted glycosyltransferase
VDFVANSLPHSTIGSSVKSEKPLHIALYSHDTVGLGHTRRNLLIAQALTYSYPNASILMLTGAATSGQFSPLPQVDFLTLPSLTKGEGGDYESRTLEVSLKQLLKLRSRAIWAALKTFKPDVFIVDNVPKGAAGELERSLGKLRRKGRTRCVLGLRDILDEPEAVRRQWAKDDNEAAIAEYFDDIWVYGDRRVYDQASEYGFSARTAAKLRYLGYFDQRAGFAEQPLLNALPDGAQPERGKLVLAQVGGGQDGAALALAFARTRLPKGHYGVLVTGPFMPAALRAELEEVASHNPDVTLLGFVKEPTRLLQHADKVIAMGGYNTTFEALSFAKPLLTVPRVEPRREQLVRVERLHGLGLLDVLHPDDLTPAALSDWLTQDTGVPDVHALDFGAMTRLPEALAELLGEKLVPTPVRGAVDETAREVFHVAA